jgi:hypothetical protein
MVQRELELAMLCMSYMTFPSFEIPISTSDVLHGDFGFLDYAVLNWLRHLEAGIKLADQDHTTILHDCQETLEVFIDRCWNIPSVTFKITQRTLEIFNVFSESPKFHRIKQSVASMRKLQRHFGEMRPREHSLNLARLVAAVRDQIEAVAVTPSSEITKSIEERYGNDVYKCPRFSCRYFTDGFRSRDEQKKHWDRHERPFRCKDDEQCPGYQIGFATEPQLAKHMYTAHPDAQQRSHQFPTEAEVTQSMEAIVLEPELPPEPMLIEVPEPMLIEVPEPESESEPEVAAIVQPRAEHREAKRPKTKVSYSCTHCPRIFTKKWNWQSHLATHEGGEQLSCNTCGQKCARMSDLTRHMRVKHSGGKSFTCGGCHKSFNRRDILQSHLRSKKGQACFINLEATSQADD